MFGQSNNNNFGGPSTMFDRKSLFKQYNLDPGGNNENGAMLRNISAYNYGPAASRTAFNAGLEGNYQQSIRQMLSRLQNRNYAMQGQRAANSTRAAYGQGQALADQSARAQGLGMGAQLGGQAGLSSQAARGAAAAEEAWMDPRRRDQDLMQALQLLSQSQGQNPYLDQIMAAFAPIEGRAQQNAAERQAGSWQGIVGNLVGQYVGSGALSGLGGLGRARAAQPVAQGSGGINPFAQASNGRPARIEDMDLSVKYDPRWERPSFKIFG